MADGNKDSALELGVFGRRQGRGFGPAELIALVLSALWLFGVSVYFALAGFGEPGPATTLAVVAAVILPMAVIWLTAIAARSARIMRLQSSRLESALDGMRSALVEAQQSHALGSHAVSVEKKLDELALAQRQTDSTIATFVSSRPQSARRLAPPPEQAARLIGPSVDEAGQASLALGTPAEALAAPVSVEDVIRAVNFPENADDAEGFEALRRALSDRKVAHLIQAAQDVLTLLAQDGIYMDDLRPDRARPEVWRRFAQGTRGRPVAALGGIRDRSSLALTAGRMRQDTIFRDAAHHFLRRFDDVISALEPDVGDEELAEFGNTRTARAFMLLGRVTGTFD